MKNRPEGYFDGVELSVRCHFCGDSTKHPNQCHASINVISGLYYCFRCQASGKMSSYDMDFLTKGLQFDRLKQMRNDPQYQSDSMIRAIEERLVSGPGIHRYSALDRYHIPIEDGVKLDIFKMVDPSLEVYGYHIRHPTDKSQSRTFGKRLLGIPSKIRYNKPWRIVEGPWDCIDPHIDICCFGFPSEIQAKILQGQELILCPDGDVFEDWRKLRQFMKPFLWSRNQRIAYIERLPPGKDPDEIMPKDRERLSVQELRKMLTPKKTFFVDRMSAEQIWQEIQNGIPEEEFWAEYEKGL